MNFGIRKRYLRKFRKALFLRRKYKLTGTEIARRLGLKRRTVCLWLREKRTLGAVQVREYHFLKYRKALSLWRDSKGKLSGGAIARKLGLYPRTVNYWLKKEATNAQRGKKADR